MKHLNKDNFAEEIQSGLVFVKFATKNGCRPCAEFKEKYEKAEDEKAKFCTYERETLPKSADDLDEVEKKYQIQSFPTILVFEDGEMKGTMPKYKFYSNRDLAGMILDEQKKLYNQQCFVEDLQMELQSRQPAPKPPLGMMRSERIDTLKKEIESIKEEIEEEQTGIKEELDKAIEDKSILDFVLPNVPPAPHEEGCTEGCQ